MNQHLVPDSSPVKYNGTTALPTRFSLLWATAPLNWRTTASAPNTACLHEKRKPHPSDRTALNNSSLQSDSDWITFKPPSALPEDQIALAPGYTCKGEMDKNACRCFPLRWIQSDQITTVSNSGPGVLRDNWNGVSLEIYHHPGTSTT